MVNMMEAFHAVFEWSYFRILSTDSKARTTLHSRINSTTLVYSSFDSVEEVKG